VAAAKAALDGPWFGRTEARLFPRYKSKLTHYQLVRRFYEEIDKGNINVLDELVAEDYLDHSPAPFPGLETGREGLKRAFRMFWEATPGHHKIEEQIAEGDKVVTRLTCYGKT